MNTRKSIERFAKELLSAIEVIETRVREDGETFECSFLMKTDQGEKWVETKNFSYFETKYVIDGEEMGIVRFVNKYVPDDQKRDKFEKFGLINREDQLELDTKARMSLESKMRRKIDQNIKKNIQHQLENNVAIKILDAQKNKKEQKRFLISIGEEKHKYDLTVLELDEEYFIRVKIGEENQHLIAWLNKHTPESLKQVPRKNSTGVTKFISEPIAKWVMAEYEKSNVFRLKNAFGGY